MGQGRSWLTPPVHSIQRPSRQCLQSYKLEREISNRVIAHLANGGARLCVVTVVDKEVEETPPQYLRDNVCVASVSGKSRLWAAVARKVRLRICEVVLE